MNFFNHDYNLTRLDTSLIICIPVSEMAQTQRYGDEHRIFLQGIMCNGILDQKAVRNLFEIAMARVEGMNVRLSPRLVRTYMNPNRSNEQRW